MDHTFFVMRTPIGGGSLGAYLVDFEVSVIPEAATLGLVGFTGLAILFVRRKLSM